MLKECLIILLLIVLNAFFAMSEMALVSSKKPLLRQLAAGGNRRAKMAVRLADDSGRFLSTVQVGITLIGILAGAYGGANIADRLTPFFNDFAFIAPKGEMVAVILVVGIITYLSVIVGELVPKQIALRHAEILALNVAYPMFALSMICTPVVVAFEKSARLLMRILGFMDSDEKQITEAEVKAMFAEGLASGLIEQHENQMLHSVLDLTKVTVDKVMTHRKNIEMLDADAPLDVILDHGLSSPYTRIPLYQDHQENVIGVLHTKLLARQIRMAEPDKAAIDLTAAISEPWFIPETTTLLEQLQVFRERKEHFALIVDEYGALLGLVTREDILEEIVGNMDELDDYTMPRVQYQPQENKEVIVEGTKTIRELNREYGWDLPDGNYATVAGLILYEAHALPDVGRSFTFFDFRFDILARQRNQITSIRVTPLKAGQPAESPPQ